MITRELGIGLPDRDLRTGLAELLTRILHEHSRRVWNQPRLHPVRNREIHRLNRLAEERGINEIVVAFFVFVQRYGRRAKDPYKLFLRKFNRCLATGFGRVYADEIKATGWNNPTIGREEVNNWIYWELEERGLLVFARLVSDYPRWGRGVAELDVAGGFFCPNKGPAEIPAIAA